MNNHLYRIVFNQHRGQLMVVAEHASANGKDGGGQDDAPSQILSLLSSLLPLLATLRPLTLAMLAALGMLCTLPAAAQIVADRSAPASQRPTVLATANGLPQVNIQTPSAAGVSRNTYTQFDVAKAGMVLNNGRTDSATKLGGWVQANPWLATGSARVILNEVNSSNPSQLNGYIEVAGPRTEVIIANPAGIHVDGAGFINASRATLTTGTAIVNNGALTGFLVQGGTVTINGQGLDASSTDYTGILARAAQINAGIWANELKVVTGANQISADQGTVSPSAATGAASGAAASTAPAFALDIAQLGGMYANKIFLIGTEAGVGVRTAGTLAAATGPLVLQANGWLSNSGSITAKTDVSLAVAGDVSNSGTVYASGNASVTSQGSILHSGLIAAQNNVTVQAGGAISAASSAVFASGMNVDGSINTSGDLQISSVGATALHGSSVSAGNTSIRASALNLASSHLSGAQLTLTATMADIDASQSVITAANLLQANTATLLRLDGAQIAANQITLGAHDLSNVKGTIAQSGASDLTIALEGMLNNDAGHISSNSTNLALSAHNIINTDGQINHAGSGLLGIQAITSFDGERGAISSNGALTVQAGAIDHAAAVMQAAQITLQTTTLSNTQGRITAARTVAIAASTSVDNTNGLLSAGSSLALTGGALTNAGGAIESGLQSSSGDITLNLGSWNNGTGTVSAGRNLTATALDLSNSGSLYALGAQSLGVRNALSNSGAIAAQGDVRLQAGAMTSTGVLAAGVKADGSFASLGNLTLNANGALIDQGQSSAFGNASANGASIDLTGAKMSAANIALTATSGNITTSGATVTTPGVLAINASTQNSQGLVNNQGVLSAAQLQWQLANLNNTQGHINVTGNSAASGDTSIILTSPAGTFDNTLGQFAVNSNNLTLQANTFTNTDGVIKHAGSGPLAITATTLNDLRGQISSNGAVNISTGAFEHSNASTTAQRINITAASLDNTGGAITALGANANANAASITVVDALNNNGGQIASNGNTSISAASLANAGGTLRTAGSASLAIAVSGPIDNTANGAIAAGGALTLNAANLLNSQGSVTAGGALNASVAQAIGNAGGLIAAVGDMTLTGSTLDNTIGRLASVKGKLSATTLGGTVNDGGRIEALGDVTLRAAGFSNSAGGNAVGTIQGSNVTLDSGAQLLNNHLGTISATLAVTLNTGALNNDAGAIQAGSALNINTHGQALTNTNSNANTSAGGVSSGISSGVTSGGSLVLATGDINNAAGYLGAAGSISGAAGVITNKLGQIVSQTNINLSIAGLSNQGGQIQTLGDLVLNAGAGAIDNRLSLIRAGGSVSLQAAGIDNSTTLSTSSGAGQGIEGNNAALNAATLNNSSGAIRAANNITVTSTGSINNNNGLMSAANTLSLQDNTVPDKTLAIVNNGGTLIGGQNVIVNAASLSGDGQVLSKGDMTLALASDFANTASGVITANGNVTFSTSGNVVNSGKVQAGKTLNLKAKAIDNSASGDISANTTQLNAAGSLTNRGVIDGGSTELNAGSVTNLGTGRIYGDHVSIAAASVTNDVEAGTAATIAARVRLDIGTQTITNNEHALIFSGGDMAIGGALDAVGTRTAIGQAGTFTNASATIEAMGDLSLNVAQVNNRNLHLTTDIEAVGGPVAIVEYQGQGAATMYLAGTPGVSIYNDESDHLSTPDGAYEKWSSYNVTRNTSQTTILTSDPGQILASGNLTIASGNVFNDNSQIIAGNVLKITSGALNNAPLQGQQITSDSGTVTSHWRDFRKGRDGNGTSDPSAYNPPDVTTNIDVTVSQVKQNAPTSASAISIASLAGTSVNATTSSTGAAQANVNPNAIIKVVSSVAAQQNASGATASLASAPALSQVARISPRVGQIAQVALATLSGASDVVRTTAPSLRIPNTSLFHISPNPTANYLVVTDPRFANYRQWLSSDYLLTALSIDPGTVQKRLGDGFYEQGLIRDQVAQLTGQRFIGDYQSDDDEYRGLMNAGVAFAKQYQLRPGIALTSALMASLTSDIVWLVEQTVTLPDGSTTQALVPQVYAMVKAGDLNGSGALLSGRSVVASVTKDLTNSGAINGRDSVDLSADNVANLGGRINGDAIHIAARTDLNNIGGAITAGSALLVSAGRDIKVASTTTSSSNAEGSRSSIDQVGGLYVTGNGGTLVATAGRDVNLMAGVVSNAGANGATALSAANNLNLNSVAVGDSKHIVWDANNQRSDASSTDIGSKISGAGSIALSAGADLNAKALTLQAGQNVAIAAGNNVNITAGSATNSVDEAHQHTSSGFMSKTIETTSDKLSQSTAIASSISAGGNMSVTAGTLNKGDINLIGSTLTSTGALSVVAAGDINIKAAQQTSVTDNSTASAIKGTLSSGSNTNTSKTSNSSILGSSVSGGSVAMSSGRDIAVQGSTIVADKDIVISAARDLSVISAQNTQTSNNASSSTNSGLMSGSMGFAIGKVSSNNSDADSSVTQAGSQIASLAGNVKMKAGGVYTQTASQIDALAPATGSTGNSTAAGDVSIVASKINMSGANDSSTSQNHADYSKTALGVTVDIPIVDAVKSISSLKQAAGKTSDSRMQALAAATLVAKTMDLAKAAATPTTGVKVSLSLSNSKTASDALQASSTVVGSTVSAAGNVSIIATGAGAASTLDIIGSTVSAGNNATVLADGKINLAAATNTSTQTSTNSGSGWSAGVGYTFGPSAGTTFDFGANKANGTVKGQDTSAVNTYIKAGNTATLSSGGDTSMIGAVISGNTVDVNVAGKLNIASVQDTSTYASKNNSASVGLSLCIPPFCYGSSTASGSLSQSTVSGDYASVFEQSGIKAGDGGFHVNVAGNTDLKGAVIASSVKAISDGANSLHTATLSTSDVQNTDHYNASGFGISGSVSGKAGDQTTASNAANKAAANSKSTPSGGGGFGGASGSQNSTTKAGISGGAIVITDAAAQQALTGKSADATLAGVNQAVSTDVDSSGALKKAWNGAALGQEVQAQVQITTAFGQVAAKGIGDYADKKREEAKSIGDKDEAAKWDEGGIYRVAAHTAAGALSGGIAGAVGAASSATLMPVIGKQIDEMDLPDPVKQALGAATAAAIGAATGGTAGAATAFNIDVNNRQLHPDETKWIKNNAAKFATQNGISVAEAEQRLGQQAFRQVQFGVSGETDVQAMSFLSAAHGMLAADPNCSTCGPGYMFFATPEQKTNAGMYASTLPQTAGFYQTNGLKQPSLQQIINSATTDSVARGVIAQRTITAAIAAGSLALSPALGGVTTEVAAFAKNPLGYCLLNLAACTVGTEAIGYGLAGVPQPGTIVPRIQANGQTTIFRTAETVNISDTTSSLQGAQLNDVISQSTFAKSLQGGGNYPGVDTFRDITLKKGTIIFGGAPGQSNFYTTASALERADGVAETFFNGLQVSPHPFYGYRPGVTAYEVISDSPAAFGRTLANPQHGGGGYPQIVIDNYQTILRPIYSTPLK